MQILSARSTATTGVHLCRVTPVILVLALILVGCGLFGGGSDGGGDLSPPSSPTDLNATSQDGAIGLEWNDSKGANTYRVYRSTSSDVDVSGSPLETGISPSDYMDDTADNGTTYYYVVTAVASEGGESAESGPSNEVEKTPFSDPPDRP